jgi:hypothetical protein
MHAPKAVILLLPVANGDRGVWRKTQRRNYDPPPKSRRPPGFLRQEIPPDQREALKRAADAMREAHARQIAALHEA